MRHTLSFHLSTALLFLFISAGPASAQWSTNSGNTTTSDNVGVGTTSPGAKLDVQTTGATDVNVAKFLQTNSSTGNQTYMVMGQSLATGRSGGFGFTDNTDGVSGYSWLANYGDSPASGEGLVVKKGGNVGIGTTAPRAALEIADSDADPAVYVTEDTNNWGAVYWNKASNQLRFHTSIGGSASDKMAIDTTSGNVGIGTASPSAKLDVVGDIASSGAITAAGTISGGNILAKYQDIAEWVPATTPIPAGFVVVLDELRTNAVTASFSAYDTKIAGVISYQPGLILGEAGTNKVQVATTGRVKVRADATATPIRIGDLLVTSEKAGTAMRSEPLQFGGVAIHRPGTLLGKALEPLAEGEGEILILLSLQ